MSELNQLVVRAKAKPVVEIDPTCHAVYIRFSSARVQKTLSDNRQGAVLTVDLDARNQIIGIELIGVRNISIAEIRRVLPDHLKGIDLDRASWTTAASCLAQGAAP
jgi:uncharacterized protein YuzE